MRLRSVASTLAVGLLFFATTSRTKAQASQLNNSTATPVPGSDTDYIKLLSETVDPANGSVSIRVSVPVPKGRGPTLPFSIAYDSGSAVYPQGSASMLGTAVWITSGPPPGTLIANGGWSYTVPQRSYTNFTKTYGGPPPVPQKICTYSTNFVFEDGSGARHSLPIANVSGVSVQVCGNSVFTGSDHVYYGNINGSTFDNSTVVDADGTVYYFPYPSSGEQTTLSSMATSIEDRNGNELTLTGNSSVAGAFTVEDTLGRTVLSSSGFGTTGNTVAVAGLSSAYTVTWGTATVKFSVTSTGSSNGGECAALPAASASFPVITAIELPNGQKYQFSYDPNYGTVSKIVYPSGGYVSYTWGLNSQSALISFPDSGSSGADACIYIYDKPAILHRYVSFDGSTTALQQDFSFSTVWNSNQATGGVSAGWTSKQTTVTTHDLVRGTEFETIHSYTGVSAPEGPSADLLPQNDDAEMPQEIQTVYQDVGGAVLKTVTKTWFDLFVISSETTALGSGTSAPTSEVTYTYGPGDQVRQKEEYDFGSGAPGSLLRKTVTNYQTFGVTPIFPAAASIFDKPCQTIVYDSTGTNRVAETDYLYDGGTSVCGTAGTPSVTAVSGLPTGTHDETNYAATSSAPRANLTTITNLCIQAAPACASGNPATTYTYDETGQILTMKDPRSNTTQYSYADSYTSGTPPGSTNAYVTQITRPVTNGVNHISNYSYGYADGKLTVAKDENGQSTTYAYSDPLDRLTLATYPAAGGETTYTYNDAPPTPSVTINKEISAGSFLTTVNIMDGVGHPTERELTSDPAGTDLIVTKYDGLGRALSVTNPYRTTSDPTYGVTTYAYDSLGRMTTVTNPDSSTIQTAHTGRATEVTDEGNGTKTVQRISQSDALGRLNSECEVSSTTLSFGTSNAPAACGQDIGATGFLTSYQYDPLGNLLSVSQGGLNARSFVYDSLSHLTSSTNPESGAISYSYDASGNLTSKIAPKPNQTSSSVTVTTTNQYDALNRITSKSYNDGATPTASFAYDTCPTGGCPSGYPSTPNSVGRLVESSVSNAATFESHDAMGRAVGEWQCTPQNCGSSYFPLAYTYDLLGDVLSSSNGKNVTLSYSYNSAAQLTTLTSSLNDSNHPGTLFSTATYNAPGLLTAVKLGNGISETRAYNLRMRLTTITDGSVYDVGMAYASNGNVVAANDSVNGNWTYGTNSGGLNGYDDFNRLLLATSGSNTYSYLYDRYGNRWEQLLNSSCTAGTASCLTFDANNHESNGLLSYDAAGNVLSDNMHHYAYDAENRLTSVDSGTTATYIYDASGQRVRKTSGSVSLDYIYDLAGRVVAEVNSTGGWTRGEVFAGGRHLATYNNNTTYFIHADWLGTERARTTIAGAVYETCTSLPFGDNLQCSTSDPSPLHFTGKQRDPESNLDYFGARYDSSSLGRFMSPDPVVITPERKVDPQQLNRYAYVRNSPLRLVDPTGEILQLSGDLAADTAALCGIVGSDNCDRISVNEQNNTVSFDTTGLDLSGNEGATLVNQLVTSSDTYGFALSDTANTAGGPVKLGNDPISNLDNQLDDRYSKGKSPTDLPPNGVADQVTIDPKTAHFTDSQGRSVSLSSLAFHELAEAYGKIDGGKAYGDFQHMNVVNGTTIQVGPPEQGAHNEAVQREFKLREQSPNLQSSGRAGDQLIRDPHN